MTFPPRIAAGLMAAYLFLVAAIVFWPTADIASGSVSGIHGVLASVGAPAYVDRTAIEFATNTAMFVPLSFLGLLLTPRWPWSTWVVIGFAGSLFIETAQLALLAERSAAAVDVVANTLGALVGAVVGALARPMLR